MTDKVVDFMALRARAKASLKNSENPRGSFQRAKNDAVTELLIECPPGHRPEGLQATLDAFGGHDNRLVPPVD